MLFRSGAIATRPCATLGRVWQFLGVPSHEGPQQFLSGRQGVSRGDAFSSFREPVVALEGWQRHLSEPELDAIDVVWRLAGGPPLGDLSQMQGAA